MAKRLLGDQVWESLRYTKPMKQSALYFTILMHLYMCVTLLYFDYTVKNVRSFMSYICSIPSCSKKNLNFTSGHVFLNLNERN